MSKAPSDIKRMRHITAPQKKYRYGGQNTTDETINQILQRLGGYTRDEVRKLMSEGRVVVTINRATRKLKGTEELFVLEEAPKATETIDRFGDLELE